MIDHHGHLADPRLEPILDDLIGALRKSGVSKIIMGGTDPDDWDRQAAIKTKYPDFVETAFGIHPWAVAANTDQALESMLGRLQERLPAAAFAGEIGLDFFRCKTPEQRARQELWCARQLGIAAALHKPVVIHSVRAHDRMIALLKKHNVRSGMIHGFHGGESIGRQYIKMGFKLSIDGLDLRGHKTRTLEWLRPGDYVLESDEPLDRVPLPDAAALAEFWVDHLRVGHESLKSGAN